MRNIIVFLNGIHHFFIIIGKYVQFINNFIYIHYSISFFPIFLTFAISNSLKNLAREPTFFMKSSPIDIFLATHLGPFQTSISAHWGNFDHGLITLFPKITIFLKFFPPYQVARILFLVRRSIRDLQTLIFHTLLKISKLQTIILERIRRGKSSED